MTDPAERQLAEDRRTRAEARAVFDARLARIRAAVSGRSVKQRLTDEALNRSRGVADESMAVARESRWVIGATLLALLAWAFRRPLLRGGQTVWKRVCHREPPPFSRRLRDWVNEKVRK